MALKPGTECTFRSTMIGSPYGDRDHQRVIIIGRPRSAEEGGERLWPVRFPDGFEGEAFTGELNGYYERTKQTVEDFAKDEALLAGAR